MPGEHCYLVLHAPHGPQCRDYKYSKQLVERKARELKPSFRSNTRDWTGPGRLLLYHEINLYDAAMNFLFRPLLSASQTIYSSHSVHIILKNSSAICYNTHNSEERLPIITTQDARRPALEAIAVDILMLLMVRESLQAFIALKKDS